VKEVLASDRKLIATIALHGGGLIAQIKGKPDAQIYTLTPQNRDAISGLILEQVKTHLNA
jgi:nucleoside-triphosphatase THEP1